MGYSSTYQGTITFSRPLTFAEIKDSPFLATNAGRRDNDNEIELATNIITTPTEQGLMQVISAYGVTVIDGDERRKHYSITEQLLELLEQVPADVRLRGYLEALGEDGDRWRLYAVREGADIRVHELHPRLIWPLALFGLGDDEEAEMES